MDQTGNLTCKEGVHKGAVKFLLDATLYQTYAYQNPAFSSLNTPEHTLRSMESR